MAMKATTVRTVSLGMGDGSADAGGISLLMFAEDGGMSYLGQHPTWVFPWSAQMARPCKVRSSAAHAPALRSLLDLSCPERQSLDSFCAERSDPSRSPG